MNAWLRRIPAALRMTVTWAAGWFSVGMAIEVVHEIAPNRFTAAEDIWPIALAIPGLVGGALFAAIARIAAGRPRFDELSLARASLFGAVSGLLVGGAAVAVGFASPSLPRSAAVLATTSLLGALSAFASTLLFRRLRFA